MKKVYIFKRTNDLEEKYKNLTFKTVLNHFYSRSPSHYDHIFPTYN